MAGEYGAGRATEGAVAVAVPAVEVAAAVAAGGTGALAGLEVAPAVATGVAWAGFVATGKAAAFAYRLTPVRASGEVRSTTVVFGPPAAGPLARAWAQFTLRPSLYLPVAKNER